MGNNLAQALRQIQAWFTYKQPTTLQRVQLRDIGARYKELSVHLATALPGGPEKIKAIDDLRNSMTWAKLSILYGDDDAPL